MRTQDRDELEIIGRESTAKRERREMRPGDAARQRARREARRKKRRRQVMIVRCVSAAVFALILAGAVFGIWKASSLLWDRQQKEDAVEVMRQETEPPVENRSAKPEIQENFLTPNEYSRPGESLPEVTELFVHYTANAGTSAAQNRSYFENLGVTGETSASAHFVIGYEDEIGYAVKEHNYNSLSIECCYLKESGEFEEATYQSLIRLLGWLLKEYDLSISDIRRHYDAGGKKCPLYYVEHEDAWEQLKKDLADYIAGGAEAPAGV